MKRSRFFPLSCGHLAYFFELNESERLKLTEMLSVESDASLKQEFGYSYARAAIESDSPSTAWKYLGEVNMSDQERRTVMSAAIIHEMKRNHRTARNLLQWLGENGRWFGDSQAVGQMVNHWRMHDKGAADRWAERYQHLFDQSKN